MSGPYTTPLPPLTDTSGSGGSSGPTAEEQANAQDAAYSAFREILRRWGLRPTKNLLNLMQKAFVSKWNQTQFVDHLRHTPEYHAKFPGLRYGDGMTEASYNSQYKAYRDAANNIGEPFSRKQFAKALKNGVEPDEFQQRMQAIDLLDKWGPQMEGFKEVLVARGEVASVNDVTKGELMKLVMGIGEKKWEKIWQETVVTMNLERVAGITVGKPPQGWGVRNPNKLGGGSPASSIDQDWMHISRKDMLTIINQVESMSPGTEVENISGQQWRDIGLRMRQFDHQYLAKYGITAKDLLEMELGGPRASAIADKSQRILKEQEAFYEPRAVPIQAQAVGQQGSTDLPQQQ